MSEAINHDRRSFLRNAAMTLAASELATFGAVNAQSNRKALKQIEAGLLNVGYAEAGPADGPGR